MGKKSVKQNKSYYQLCREDAGMTRAEASEALETISESRLEKLENEKTPLLPADALTMAKAYGKPELCNYYCRHNCEIGELSVPQVVLRDLPQITLQLLSAVTALNAEKDRLIEIAADGKITENELPDFSEIREQLEKMSVAIEELKLWAGNELVPEQK